MPPAPGFLPAAPVREHLLRLMATGLSLHRIAQGSGMSLAGLNAIVYGPARRDQPRRVRAYTAQAVLSVVGHEIPYGPGDRVPSIGVVRRIQALRCLGWTLARMASEAGISERAMYRITVRATHCGATVDRVRALYDRLSMAAPPTGPVATRTRNQARAAGWAPPLAWDDDRIDDPSAEPWRPAPPRRRPGGTR